VPASLQIAVTMHRQADDFTDSHQYSTVYSIPTLPRDSPWLLAVACIAFLVISFNIFGIYSAVGTYCDIFFSGQYLNLHEVFIIHYIFSCFC
jgi:hypothetical protein